MYYEGVEWSGAASATVVSTEYFGTAQNNKKQMQRPHISDPISFTALSSPSNHMSVSTWYGREGLHDITLPIPIYGRYDTVWM